MTQITGIPELRSNQRRAIEALVTGANVPEAAAAAGVSESTIYRWRGETDFAAALRIADGDALRDLARRITSAANDALTLLQSMVNDNEAAASVRVRAAAEILNQRARFYDVVTMQDQLDDVEARLQEAGL